MVTRMSRVYLKMNRFSQLDHALLAAARRYQHPVITLFFKTITHLGSPWCFAVLCAAFWGWGTPFTLLLFHRLAASGVAYLLSELIKRVYARRRPGLAVPDHRALIPTPGSHSFPSGHAATTVAAAVAFASVDTPLAAVAAVLAGLVSFSRVYLGVHFPFDVSAGALLGMICGVATPFFIYPG